MLKRVCGRCYKLNDKVYDVKIRKTKSILTNHRKSHTVETKIEYSGICKDCLKELKTGVDRFLDGNED